MKCEYHLCNNVLSGKQKKFCSRSCGMKHAVLNKRRNLKTRAVAYKGGKCEKCGYDRCIGALEFHHQSQEHKDFGISSKGYTRSWEKVKDEIDKCLMVCSNCHREIHSGLS